MSSVHSQESCVTRLLSILLVLTCISFALVGTDSAAADMSDWQHSGTFYIITTAEGAGLPATAVENNFPLLVRLDKDFFDFRQAQAHGQDIRFTDADGSALAYQIEQWQATAGTASIWVRVPTIRGNAQQAITMHWGHSKAAGESNGEKVFMTGEGFAGVWHLGDNLEDATANNLDGVDMPEKATVNAAGVIGDGQEFGVNRHLVIRPPNSTSDRRVTCMPSGNEGRSMSAWAYPTSFEGRNWASASIGGWGEPKRPQKPNMGLSYMTMTGRGQPRFHLYGFDPRCATILPRNEWSHVALSVSENMVRFYVDGVLQKTIDNRANAVTKLGTLLTPESTPVDLGDHGHGRGPFNGALDEVRFESAARSSAWMKLCFDNQKPLQTLVGPLVQEGNEFSVSESAMTMKEGTSVTLSAKAGGARKTFWVLTDGDSERLLAVDRFTYSFDAGRVAESKTVALQFKALFASGMRTKTIRIAIQEDIPDPAYTLKVPRKWDGRDELVLAPTLSNRAAMKAAGADTLNASWTVSGMATISKVEDDKLILKRAQNSGLLTVALALDNGGDAVSQTVTIPVKEPGHDDWVERTAGPTEKPMNNQFYARSANDQAILHYNGTLEEAADSVFLKLYAGNKLVDTDKQRIRADKTYALSTMLKAGLVNYRIEFGTQRGRTETVTDTATNLVCGDAFIIQGQSNAEAWTDERVVHPYRSDWLRSFGTPSTNKDKARDVVWGNALSFNGGENHHHLQIGYWGVELGKMLIEEHKVPIFIINGAQGGTRVDQHLRNEDDPTDVSSIYGRLLWRLRQAKLTHGIRGVLWHQGEADQGVSGPTGTFGWEKYQEYFIQMTAAWKEDYPNIQHYYIYQIWPGACGSRSVENDRLRESQRRLPQQFSNMSIMSTLGIRPGGGCHHPPEGYAVMAQLMFPLVNQHNYGVTLQQSTSAPDIREVYYTTAGKDEMALVFDQDVTFELEAAGRFYLDGEDGKVVSGDVSGNILTLKLAAPSAAKTVTYIKGGAWRQESPIVWGINGVAALTFCEVPIGFRP